MLPEMVRTSLMSKKTTRLHQVLLIRGMTMRELADQLGLSLRTIHNIAASGVRSAHTRERISIFLKETIWKDLPVRTLTIPGGAEFETESAEQAGRDAAEFGDSAKAVGNSVRFLKATAVVVAFPLPARANKRQRMSARSADATEHSWEEKP